MQKEVGATLLSEVVREGAADLCCRWGRGGGSGDERGSYRRAVAAVEEEAPVEAQARVAESVARWGHCTVGYWQSLQPCQRPGAACSS